MLNFENIKMMVLIFALLLSNSACGAVIEVANIVSAVPDGPEPNLTFIEIGAPRADMEAKLGKPACKATGASADIKSVIYSFDLEIKDTTGWLEVGYDKEDKVKEYKYSHFDSEVCESVFTLTPPIEPEIEIECDPGIESCD
jgi:hypothetical protein